MPLGGGPQIVGQAKHRPGRCLASGDTEGPFIDCGRYTRENDPYVHLSVRWFEETARNLLGMVTEAEVKEHLAEVYSELERQDAELKELRQLAEATKTYEEAREVIRQRHLKEAAQTVLDREPETTGPQLAAAAGEPA